MTASGPPPGTELPEHVVAVRDRHATYFAEFCRQAAAAVLTVERRAWLDRFTLEHDNVTAALSWALERGDEKALSLAVGAADVWNELGTPRESRDWLDRVTSAFREPSALRAMALTRLARAARVTGDQPTAWARFDEAVATARLADDRLALADALRELGWHHFFTGDPAAALAAQREALMLLQSAGGDIHPQIKCLHGIGWALLHMGDEAKAKQSHLQARALARESGDPGLLFEHLGIEANLHRALGELETASDLCEECLSIAATYGLAENRLWILWYLADISCQQGALDRARETYLSLVDEAGLVPAGHEHAATGYRGLAEVAQLSGEGPQARHYYEQSLRELRSVREPTADTMGSFLADLVAAAEAAADEGDHGAALALLREKAVSAPLWSRVLGFLTPTDLDFLRHAELTGDDAQAQRRRRALLELWADRREPRTRIRWHMASAAEHIAAGDLSAAVTDAAVAVEASRDAGTGRPHAYLLLHLARIQSEAARHTEALAAAQEAVTLQGHRADSRHMALLGVLAVQLASGSTADALASARTLAPGWRLLGTNLSRLELVERLAELALARGQGDRARELMGLVISQLRTLGFAVPVLYRARHARNVEAAQQGGPLTAASDESGRPLSLAAALDREAAALAAEASA